MASLKRGVFLELGLGGNLNYNGFNVNGGRFITVRNLCFSKVVYGLQV